MEYDATTALMFGIPPYPFFNGVGLVFAISLFIVLLLKDGHSVPRYAKIFLLSPIGLLLGAKLFRCFAGLYAALADNAQLTLGIFVEKGLVYYGGMLGLLAAFLLLCKVWNKHIDYEVVDLAVICIPLFHFWGRLACFFAGCCYGAETDSFFSVLYTTGIEGKIITASRIPVQLIEAGISLAIFAVLLKFLSDQRFRGRFALVYLLAYAMARMSLEFFRGDMHRGLWNGISFSQFVSVLILLSCSALLVMKKPRLQTHESAGPDAGIAGGLPEGAGSGIARGLLGGAGFGAGFAFVAFALALATYVDAMGISAKWHWSVLADVAVFCAILGGPVGAVYGFASHKQARGESSKNAT